ncbi:MAG: helix-hairpin-helix domain-containing protein, partial [Minisyncoccales bacterium]
MKASFLNKKNKKFFISIVILFFLLPGGIFCLARAGFVNFSALGANIASVFNNKDIQLLKSSLEKIESELSRLQEENELLKEALADSEERLANLESKYESELVNLSQAIDSLGQTINSFKKVAVLGTSTEEATTSDESTEETEICSVNLNTASLSELEKLTGIGPVLAQRIIAARPFSSIYELTKVSGIGETTLQKIIDQGCAYVENDIGPSASQPVYSSGSGGRSSGGGSGSGSSNQECTPNSVEINTASLGELDKLTGVGPSTAQKIIDGRPFFSLDDLINVSGIGTTTLEEIKDQGCAYIDASLLPPIASFTFLPQNPIVGEEVLFDASLSTSSAGQIISYLWDFGDDSTTSADLATITHSFATSSQFLVTLLITNDRNATNSTTTTVNVQPAPEEP